MKKIDKKKPVLVTGGTGYIASWIVKYLLDDKRHVRATVRDKTDKVKTGHLLKMGKETDGNLELHEADLLKEGAFQEAMEGCELVIHAASPFFISGIKEPGEQLIKPALEGTRNVLSSAGKTGTVKRVVLTSSMVAIYGDATDITKTANGVLTEEDWNTSSSISHQPYPYSKTLAEKEAWTIAENQDNWDLVTINPGFVLGPSLTRRIDSTSIDIMCSMLNGKYKQGVPDLYFPVVDVRTVARAHILAADNPKASGRHILVSETATMLQMGQMIKEKFQDYPIPKRLAPKPILYIIGPLQGLSWKYLKLNIGIPLKIDNSRSIEQLNVEYLPIKTTLQEHATQVIQDGLV